MSAPSRSTSPLTSLLLDSLVVEHARRPVCIDVLHLLLLLLHLPSCPFLLDFA